MKLVLKCAVLLLLGCAVGLSQDAEMCCGGPPLRVVRGCGLGALNPQMAAWLARTTTVAAVLPRPPLAPQGLQLAAGAQPLITIPLQAVRLADDDGSRRCPIEPGEILKQVESANTVYASANIRFTFDPLADFSDMRSSLANRMPGNPAADVDWDAARRKGNEIAANYPGKMLLLYRTGPLPFTGVRGGTGPGGFSWWDYSFIGMSSFNDVYTCPASQHKFNILAHEIGHHLGLPHTFGGLFETETEAAADFTSRGNNPAVYDGDGIADTPPHPSIRTHECPGPSQFTLNGLQFALPRDNIMSYYKEANAITPLQGARARWLAQNYLRNGMLAPSNQGVQGVVEGESLLVEQSTHFYNSNDVISWAGRDGWSGDKQLFMGWGSGGSLTVEFTVATGGQYQIDYYGTQAADYGIVQCSVDEAPLGVPVDCYAPVVLPTGRVPLGTVSLTAGTHRLKLQSTGKNPLSTGYLCALDCLKLSKLSQVEAPAIKTSPLAQAVTAGQTAMLSVTATGSAPLAYQWRKNGVNIPGATGASYTIPNAQPSAAASYSVVVSNSGGSVPSATAVLTVSPLANPQRMEGENIWVAEILAGNGFSNQDMLGFGSGWSGGKQIFMGLVNGGSVTLSLPINRDGVYRLEMVATKAGDYGRVQCSLDGANAGPVVDAYATSVQPSGRIVLGTFSLAAGAHRLKFQSVGKNPLSSGYLFGVDFVELAGVSPPVITSAAAATATIGQSFSYQITADNAPTGYDATGLPAGLSVNTATGLITGTPTAAGTSSVTLSASNAGGPGTKTLTLTVNPPAPVITSAATASATVGAPFSYQITANNAPTSFSATGLPAGLSVNTATGLVSGTPTAAGTSTVTLSASNAGGPGTKTLTLTVNPPAPVITSAATATATVGAPFSYQITANNAPTSFSATGLPAGLSVNTATGLISGTPTAAGTSTVTLSASNAGGTANKTLILSVPGSLPVITVQPMSVVAVAPSNAMFNVSATGTVPLSYQWFRGNNLLSGAVGASFTLLATNRSAAGSYFVVVTNAFGSVTSSTAQLRVLVPQRLLPPERLGSGHVQLRFGDQDGRPLGAGDVTSFEVYATTNLFNPNAWMRLPNNLSLTNGQLWLEDTDALTLPRRFYRVIER